MHKNHKISFDYSSRAATIMNALPKKNKIHKIKQPDLDDTTCLQNEK